jgi:PBSX family phage terminase large subunit
MEIQETKIEIQYTPLPTQRRFHSSKAKFKAFISGIGAGKTTAGCVESIREATKQPGSHGIIVAQTYRVLEDTIKPLFFKLCPKEIIKDYIKGEVKLILINGSDILFRSGEDPEKLRGLNLAWFWMDEAALQKEKVFQILLGRIRQVGYELKGWVTTTPKGFTWIHKYWVAEPQEGFEMFQTSTRENTYLLPEYVEDLEKNYTGVFANQEIEGQFVSFEGVVFPYFNLNIHSISDEAMMGKFNRVVAGVDFGFTNPSVCLFIGIDDDNNLYIFDEIYERKLPSSEFFSMIEDRNRLYNADIFYCDPSEPGLIDEMNRRGIMAMKADNDIMAGISRISNRLKGINGKPSLYISDKCVNTIMEFQNYRYPTGKDDKPIQEKPLKIFDHSIDSARYCCNELDKMFSLENMGGEVSSLKVYKRRKI